MPSSKIEEHQANIRRRRAEMPDVHKSISKDASQRNLREQLLAPLGWYGPCNGEDPDDVEEWVLTILVPWQERTLQLVEEITSNNGNHGPKESEEKNDASEEESEAYYPGGRGIDPFTG